VVKDGYFPISWMIGRKALADVGIHVTPDAGKEGSAHKSGSGSKY